MFSKTLTDGDSYDADHRAADHYNRRLEKSIGQYDVPHNFKFSYVYELPFGRGKQMLTSGVGAVLLGGWRLSGTHVYYTGTPLPLTNSTAFALFSGRSPAHITTYEGWVADHDDADWLGGDRYFNNPETFAPASLQYVNRLGNATRFNPKARYPGRWTRTSHWRSSSSSQKRRDWISVGRSSARSTAPGSILAAQTFRI